MSGNSKQYTGEIGRLPGSKIYLNIKHLEKGHYELNIMDQQKPIKKITFKKT